MRCYKFGVKRTLRLAILLGVLALLAPAAASAYPWPIRPFYEQHAVRGYFNDPRLSGPEQGFHFGVDISAPDGTPVYAVTSGYARVHGMAVSIIPWRRGVPRLSYWHVVPAVSSKQFVRKFELIGYVLPGAGHVHLAEWKNGTYINPLRIGGLAPYIDDTVPRIPSLTFSSAGLPVEPEARQRHRRHRRRGVRHVPDADSGSLGAVDLRARSHPVADRAGRRRRSGTGRTPSTSGGSCFRLTLYDFVYAPGTSRTGRGAEGATSTTSPTSSTRTCFRTARTPSRSTPSTSRRTSVSRRSRSPSRIRLEAVEGEPRVLVGLRQVELQVEAAVRDDDPVGVEPARDRHVAAVQEADDRGHGASSG